MADEPPLDFDTAHYAPPAACAVCGEAIAGPHFRVGAAPVCPPCRDQLEAVPAGPEALGRAAGYGLAAAAGAALVWMQLRDLVGDFRIAALPVAWSIAWVIRWAAGGGGRPHQVLAVAYTAAAAAVYVATGPGPAWRDPTSAVLWLLVVGVSLASAWSRTAPTRLPFEAVS